MLKVSFGYGTTYEDAIQAAIELYNTVEGRKTFHKSNTTFDGTGCRCEIWFELSESAVAQAVEEKFEYIGSTTIDPSDPDWKKKWEENNQLITDKIVWDKDRFKDLIVRNAANSYPELTQYQLDMEMLVNRCR